MGSRLTVAEKELAYIAGFLDGDGSLMLQIKKRSDGKLGIRFMVTMCLYQDTRHELPLFWIRKKLGIGYISRRNDGITELRVNGFGTIKSILKMLVPYIRFKKIQARALLKACAILDGKSFHDLTRSEKKRLLELIITMQIENYQSHAKRTKHELSLLLNLTP